MGLNILVAFILILFTVTIHGLATKVTMKFANTRIKSALKHRYKKPIVITQMVLIMFFASILEAVIWASSYVWLGAIKSLEDALYFSIVTFTTLGYGDIVLDAKWRLLSSFEASIGIIIFGWTTALVLAGVQKIYFPPDNE